MNILKIIHGYPPLYNAGSEVYSQSICNELSKTHHVTVFTREENPYQLDFYIRSERQNDHLEIFYINMARGKDGFRHSEIDRSFAQILREQKTDVAHIGHLNHLSTGIVDVLNELNIPIVYTLHDFWLMCPRGQFLQRNFDGDNLYRLCDGQDHNKCASNCYKMFHSGFEVSWSRMMDREMTHEMRIGKGNLNDQQYWSDWIEARMYETSSLMNKVNLFIAPSLYLMTRFINDFGMPQEKIIYLDYGFPVSYLTPTQKSKQQEYFTFGYIGTHVPAKGINLLIEAFKNLKEKSVLKIWGHKDAQSTRALMQLAEGSKNRIEFKGEYVNKNLADEVFSQVDCIVTPSIWAENSPLVIHEAQACHIPVITGDYGGMKEYVQRQVNGLLFNHRDINSLHQQLQWAIHNPDKMKDYGKRGYLLDTNGKVPDITQHCQRLEELYKQIIKQNEPKVLENNYRYQS